MSDTPNLSDLFNMLNSKGIDINELTSNISNMSSSDNQPNSNNNTYEGNFNKQENNSSTDNNIPDIETMMKIAKIMSKMNSNINNPSAELLYSLKPFLRESKKEKIDQYIKFIKMSSIISELNKPGGDLKWTS